MNIEYMKYEIIICLDASSVPSVGYFQADAFIISFFFIIVYYIHLKWK